MKSSALLLIICMMFLLLTSCGFFENTNIPQDGTVEDVLPPEGGGDQGNQDNSTVQPPDTDEETGRDPDLGDDNEENPDNDDRDSPVSLLVNSIKGLNEQIYVNIAKQEGYSYKVRYKKSEDIEYSTLDENLIIESENELNCYILGVSKGDYDVKIEAYDEQGSLEQIYENVSVEAQDRSGYAHFNNSGGVGAYRNDGTLKPGTKIIYITNENKNTVTLEINGKVYTGLVNIMIAQKNSDTPLLVRVIGKITTNQWEYKNVEPRLADNSNLTDDFFQNSFSTKYGENLENLVVVAMDKKDGIRYQYTTTKTGLTEPKLGSTGKSINIYKGSDYPSLKGLSVYDDDSSVNMFTVTDASNITIEGIGDEAEFFQFGISFQRCSSVEIKNMTFTDYPEDAVNFMNSDRNLINSFGGYWIHNSTFSRGYNAWDISGERDKYAGDGSIDFNNVYGITISYCKFLNSKKTILVGNSESNSCINFSMHHNYFYKVDSRLPLARNTNIHSYNNYFELCNTCSGISMNAYLFSEANYYYNCTRPFNNSGSTVKSYKDVFINSVSNGATIVTNRLQIISNGCSPDNKTDYSRFDTDSSLFYFDSKAGSTMVAHMLEAADVPNFVVIFSGAGVYEQVSVSDVENSGETENGGESLSHYPVFDLTGIEVGITVGAGQVVLAGDFKLHYDVKVEEGLIKTLTTNFSSKKSLIEFTNTDATKLTICYKSRNDTAYDRYIILFDENGNQVATSNPAPGKERVNYTFDIEPGKTYYIGSSNGLTFYSFTFGK